MQATILSGDRKGDTIHVKAMAIEDVKKLPPGSHALIYTGYFGRNRLNGIVHVKINGKPKLWKTRPGDVNIPVKYGLYEYATIEYRDGIMADENLYVVIADTKKES